MEQLPLISVVVPVYKVEQYLDQCVSSILSQTYPNLEVILVDDGSPDRCGEMCDDWARKDSRVRVLHQQNAGGGAARNAGLDLVRGALVSMIDSDDYISPNLYAYLYSLMDGDVDIAECTMAWTEAEDFPLEDGTGAAVITLSRDEAMVRHIRDELFCQTPPNKLYRRSTLADVRFPVGSMIDDEFFTYKVLGNARRLAHSSAQMYAYRQQPGSIMHRKNPVKKLEGLRAKQQRLQWLRERSPALVEEAKRDLLLSCIYAMQDCLQNLKGTARADAVREIRAVISSLQPMDLGCADSAKQRLLLRGAIHCPEAVARVLNFLISVHVLT